MLYIKDAGLRQMIRSDFDREALSCRREAKKKQILLCGSGIPDMLDRLLLNEGKLIRPVLFYLVYLHFCGRLPKDMGKIALGIELIHNASLVHDDIMDQGLVRRDKKTIVSEYGLEDALIFGDYLIFTAMDKLNAASEKNAERAGKELIRCGINLCYGQNKEKELLHNAKAEQDVYFRVIEMKTACFFKAVFQAAAIMANQEEETVENIGAAGMELGYAFQIANDIQDVCQMQTDAASSDLHRKLLTLPVILAYQNGSTTEKDRIKKYFESDCSRDWKEIRSLILQAGGVEKAAETMRRSLRTSYDILTDYGGGAALSEIKFIMYSLLDRVMAMTASGH